MLAFLCGGMEYAADGGRVWRERIRLWLQDTLNHRVYDPTIEAQRLFSAEELRDLPSWKTADPERFRRALLLAVLAAVGWGLVAGLALLLALPAVGMLGLAVRERWRGAWSDARRFFLLRSRGALVDALRETQRELGVRLQALYDRHTGATETA